MRAINVVIEWTPNREPYLAYSTRGKISVRADSEGSDPLHPMSFGANTHIWTAATDEQRLKIMQSLVYTMVQEDRIDAKAVREALSKINEFAEFPFNLPAGDPA